MYVYLRCSDSYLKTAWVSLDLQKCMPVVGTYSEGRIDPALWFKVLALGSVFVDIDRQKVFWTFKRQNVREDNLTEFFNTQEEITSISDNGDLDYDVRMAELFGTARDIYTHINAEDFDSCNESTYDDLLKILHVYILPEVQFHTKDRKEIHRVFKVIKNACKMVEMLINKKVDEEQKLKDSLARQRRSLVKTELLLGDFIDEEFNWFFFKHIEEDVKQLEDKILSLSNSIDHLKRSESEKCNSKLLKAQEERTKYVKEKEKLIVVREELKCQEANKPLPSVPRSKSLTKKNQNAARHTWYISKSKELENTNEDIKTLINSKIKLSGMREAVHLTLTELDDDCVSVGYNRKIGACKAEADVFDPSKKPDYWKTLEEQVNEHLKLNHTELKSEHDRFCSSIKGKCRKLLNTNSNITDSLPSLASEVFSILSCHGYETFSKEECENGTISKEEECENGTISKEECENGTISKEECENGTISKEECENGTTSKEECENGTISKEECENGTTSKEECENGTISKEECENGTISKEECENGTISKEECENGTISKEECENGTISKEECENGTISKEEECEDISAEVCEHILDMACTLEDELQGTHTCLPTYYTYVYICYEKHVSEDIMAVLSDVYKESYRSKCEHLYNWVSSCATTELAFMDKLIKKLFPDLNDDPMESGKQAVSQDDVIRSSFFAFFSCVHKESAKLSIFDKLSVLSDAFRFVKKHSCDLLKRNGQSTELSTDDMLDLLILLVCKLDFKCFLSLYADVNLINHLAPGFLKGSMSQYCLTRLTEVYKYLFECQEKLHLSSKEFSE